MTVHTWRQIQGEPTSFEKVSLCVESFHHLLYTRYKDNSFNYFSLHYIHFRRPNIFPVRFEQPLAGTPASLSHSIAFPSNRLPLWRSRSPFHWVHCCQLLCDLSLSLTPYRKMTAQLSSTVKEKKVTIVCFAFKLELQISCSVLTSISLVMVHLDRTHSQMLLLKTSCISGCLVS